MPEQGSFQTIKPTQHRLLPFLLMLASGFLGLQVAVLGVMGGCVLVNGELAPTYEDYAFWVRALGYVFLWLWVVPLLIALTSLVWAFVGTTSRQLWFSVVLLLASLTPVALLISASSSGPMTRGASACGDAM